MLHTNWADLKCCILFTHVCSNKDNNNNISWIRALFSRNVTLLYLNYLFFLAGLCSLCVCETIATCHHHHLQDPCLFWWVNLTELMTWLFCLYIKSSLLLTFLSAGCQRSSVWKAWGIWSCLEVSSVVQRLMPLCFLWLFQQTPPAWALFSISWGECEGES